MPDYKSTYTGEQIDEALKKAMEGSTLGGAEATTLAAGSDATASIENNVLKLGIPAGAQGIPGVPGEPGYTPIKGTDYWTEADKTEMVNAVLAALPAAEGVGF